MWAGFAEASLVRTAAAIAVLGPEGGGDRVVFAN
jgi:hypothetical protein